MFDPRSTPTYRKYLRFRRGKGEGHSAQKPPFRFIVRSTPNHKINETVSRNITENRYQTDNIPGRHFDQEPVERRNNTRQWFPPLTPTSPGLDDEQENLFYNPPIV